MTAIEYMEKQIRKCRDNYAREAKRNAPKENLDNIRAKIGYYEAAVNALKGQTKEKCDLV